MILAGIGLISTNSSYYLHAPWLHIKLTFVVLLIGLHGIVAVRTKRFGAGTIQLQRGEARLLVVATILIFISILICDPGRSGLSDLTAPFTPGR